MRMLHHVFFHRDGEEGDVNDAAVEMDVLK